ncbi:RNA polymerase subunit RPABC4/transcription elongation factor Spt4 [Dyella sp. SG562]|uniref:hypothetical protein n=1 Tax=Dyella sp. SG562 TaxID=2587017 RepID=UPI00141DDC2F|nr:hypothetical protein [Dyella sp. SG562]NII74847.1 RNA polymerase subunit RPABC4/transcription elongation factor Spt4 [Dyella sp. SG562]
MATYDTKKALDFIREKWSKDCPVCGHADFSINDRLFTMVEITKEEGVKLGGNMEVFPVLPMTCQNCGNVRLLSAVYAGLIS